MPQIKANVNEETSSLSMGSSCRSISTERLREKAARIKMKDSMTTQLCLRIQKRFKKSPSISKQLAHLVCNQLLKQGRQCDILTDDELSEYIKTILETIKEIKNKSDQQPLNDNSFHTSNSKIKDPKVLSSSTYSKKEISCDHQGKNHLNLKEKNHSGFLPPSGFSQNGDYSVKGGDPLKRGGDKRGGGGGDLYSIKGDDKRAVSPLELDHYKTTTQLQQGSVMYGTNSKLLKRCSPKKTASDDIWSDIASYHEKQVYVQKQKSQQQKIEKRKQWVDELTLQINMKEKEKNLKKQEELHFYEKSLQLLENANEIEKQKALEKQQVAQQQKLIQLQQRKLKFEQLNHDLQMKKNKEIQILNSIQKLKLQEEQQEMKKKQNEKKKLELLLIENQESMNQKKKIELQEREYENLLAQQYIQHEEEKEKARIQHLEDMSKKIQTKMKYYDDNAKAEMDAKAKEEEKRVQKYQEEYEKRLQEEEKARKKLIAEKTKQQHMELQRQIEWKKMKEVQEQMENFEQGKIWVHDCQVANKKEKQKKMDEFYKNKMQQQLLIQQMEEKEYSKNLADQTAFEIQMNRAILEKIHLENPTSHFAEIHCLSNSENGAAIAQQTRIRSNEVEKQQANNTAKKQDSLISQMNKRTGKGTM